MAVEIGVLGAVSAWIDGSPAALKGPRHRAVLARLVVARGRVVPVGMLVDDLWEDPPADAIGTLRTFVGDLRRALEPDRPARSPARVIVTEGAGYALRTESVDSVRFEAAVSATSDPDARVASLQGALALWRGPAYADFADDSWRHAERWLQAERSRLTELRLHAVELLADARLQLGHAAEAVADLDAHVSEHPWREEGWRLLGLALYRSGRQAEALEVVRRARTMLIERLGLDAGPGLRELEAGILNHDRGLDAPVSGAAGTVWTHAAASYERAVEPGSRARLRSTMDLLRSLAVTGGAGLQASRRQRLAAISAAEQLGDAELTARVIGAYDVPAIWSRSDDAVQAAEVVAAAERTLQELGAEGPESSRARLLCTIAIESRGLSGPRGSEAAAEAVHLARGLDDPALLAFALNARFMQSFSRAGLARDRDGLGAELVALSARHGLVTSELLGRLIRLQASAALGDIASADAHADAADRLAADYESPLVGVFTGWYRALRLALTGATAGKTVTAYRSAATLLVGAGMPGVEGGLLPLALLSVRLTDGRGAPTDPDLDWGPFEPWVRPLVMLALDRRDDAAAALRATPDPPNDHLLEAMWCLVGHAAIAIGDRDAMRRARSALAPAAGEIAGAGSGMLSFGPVDAMLARLDG